MGEYTRNFVHNGKHLLNHAEKLQAKKVMTEDDKSMVGLIGLSLHFGRQEAERELKAERMLREGDKRAREHVQNVIRMKGMNINDKINLKVKMKNASLYLTRMLVSQSMYEDF